MTQQVLDLAGNIAAVQQRIAGACAQAGRQPQEITLVAVSKKMPLEALLHAVEVGITHLGENRIEEAAEKMQQLPRRTILPHQWHMIGHIQSRKAREVVQAGFTLVHSLDDMKLAQRYNNFALELGVELPVLLQVNVSGEDSKSGWHLHQWEHASQQRTVFWEDVTALLQLPGLRIMGLMTMAPIVDDPEATRPVFQAMARLRQALREDFSAATWEHLSMGMTDDFEIAIEEGATIVRVGRAIFGERPDL